MPIRVLTFPRHSNLPPSPPPTIPLNTNTPTRLELSHLIAATAIIDTLRATTSITLAISSGCRAVRPFASPGDVDIALECEGGVLQRERERGEVVVCGEQGGKRVTWFDLGNSPSEFTPERVGNRLLLMVTTNGTVALQKLRNLVHSGRVFAACLLNAKATAVKLLDAVIENQMKGGIVEPVLWLVCAGSNGNPALEDTMTAGLILSHLSSLSSEPLTLDAESESALNLARQVTNWPECGKKMEAAKKLSELGEQGLKDVDFCFGGHGPGVDGIDVVGELDRETGDVVLAGT